MRYKTFLITILSLPAATLFMQSCSKDSGGAEETALLGSRFVISAGTQVRTADLLVFGDEGLRKLEKHVRLPAGQGGEALTDSLYLNPGGKIGVILTNLPKPLNIGALETFENVEQMALDFAEDNAGEPAGSAVVTFAAGEDFAASPVPLMCRVTLTEVRNNLGGYSRLENPRVFLTNISASAEILRTDGFRPSALLANGPVEALPNDVGLFDQYPDISLYCYPNDSGLNIMGTPSGEFVFECEIRGETRQFRQTLPPLGRGTEVRLSLAVGEEAARFTVSTQN